METATLVAIQEGERHEQGTSTGWHTQRCIHTYFGRQARKMGREWSPLRGLGDVPPERIAGGPESNLCVADERLVRPDHSALRRRWQNLAPAWNTARRTDYRAGRHAQGREQQIHVRHLCRDRKATYHASVLRRDAASVGVQACVALGAFAHRS